MTRVLKIALLLLFVSCKKKEKDWTCTCEIHGPTTTTVTKQITSDLQNDADSKCAQYGHSQANGSHYVCEVK